MSAIDSTAPQSIVLKKLRKLRIAASSLRDEYSLEPISVYKHESFKLNYQEFFAGKNEVPSRDMWSFFLVDLLEFVISVARIFDVELRNAAHEAAGSPHDSFTRVEIWNSWVNCITALIREVGLPYKVRKDTDKHTGKASPFVSLIWEVQDSLPAEFRMFTQSKHALAQAIYRARRNVDFSNPEGSSRLGVIVGTRGFRRSIKVVVLPGRRRRGVLRSKPISASLRRTT